MIGGMIWSIVAELLGLAEVKWSKYQVAPRPEMFDLRRKTARRIARRLSEQRCKDWRQA